MRTARLHRMLWLAAVVSATSWVSSPAHAQDCTRAEAQLADDRLRAIESSSADQDAILARHLPFGIRQTTHRSDTSARTEQVLLQDGYVMAHDGNLRTAIWTSHRLDGADVTAGGGGDRIECFRPDPRLPADHAATEDDYDESIYDLGHMTSDRDLRDNLIEQINTYVISNMSAQHLRFNRGIWRALENRGRKWAKAHGNIYVTQGAIFDFNAKDARDVDDESARIGTRGGNARVAVPSHYFKNFLRRSGDGWLSITFLLENHNGPRGDNQAALKDAIVAMSVIKSRGEITLHPDLRESQVTEAASFVEWERSN